MQFFKTNRNEQEKKQRIHDLHNAKTEREKSETIGVSLWPLSSPDLNTLDYTIWDVFENEKNDTSHPNVGSLKTAIEVEWNKMST